ncbi:hypothetical protein K523DRAFT_414118 [Schizophyllum commune Tattone D]|nr:hypothetical protein K523DRAFT_414118 [Schizophyllum commune Tattone D]
MRDLELSLCPGCDRHLVVDGTASATQEALEAIREGDIPSDPSCVELNRAAREAELQAADLDREIKRLHALARGLQAHRDRLLGFSRQKRALAAPVRRLPIEILEVIFVHVCTSTRLECPVRPKDLLRPKDLPVHRLGRVCRRWRTVVKNYEAHLWMVDRIYVDCRLLWQYINWWNRAEDTRQFCSAIICYLEKSGAVPLDVELVRVDENVAEDLRSEEDVYGSLLDALARSISRWRTCTIPDFLLRTMIGKDCPPPAALQKITVTDLCSHLDNAILNEAPNLTEWIHHGKRATVYPSSRLLSHLTRLEAGFTSTTHFVHRVFKAAPKSLVVLDLAQREAYGILFSYLRFPEIALFPQLRRCSLAFVEIRLMDIFIRMLNTPRLEQLKLKYTPAKHCIIDHEWTWPAADFAQFLERSGCNITRLTLVNIEQTQDQESELRGHPSIGEVVVQTSESEADA